MSEFSYFPLNIDRNSPLGARLVDLWAMVEVSGLSVHFLTTRGSRYQYRSYPAYSPENDSLVVDLTKGFEDVYHQLAFGLGLRSTGYLFGCGAERSQDRYDWLAAAAKWSQDFRARYEASVQPPKLEKPAPATNHQGTPRTAWSVPKGYVRCSATRRDGCPCKAPRYAGTAFCYSHQKARRELFSATEIQALIYSLDTEDEPF